MRRDQLGNQTGPSGLMRRTDAPSVVAMKILKELEVVAEMWIRLQFLIAAEDRSLTIYVPYKNPAEPIAQFRSNLFDRQEVS